MSAECFDEFLLQHKILSFGACRERNGLADMLRLDQLLGNPHRAFASIHVAGTNGKGSVSLKIAEALRASGFRTGLYQSPHLRTFRERVVVDGQQIEEQYASQFFSSLFPLLDVEDLRPSFFTLLTALAFSYFRDRGVDYAVVETGLGGRYDATNVITPTLSVITSISYDHCELLGSSLEEIAHEKAGIIKEGIPVVIGPRARYPAILAAPHKILVGESSGFYDRENSEIARAALHALQIANQAIERGVAVRPPCRFEIVDPKPIILDVAHNPDAFSRLTEALDEFYPHQKMHLVLALGKQRDPWECIRKILHKTFRVSALVHDQERLFSAQELQRHLQVRGIAVGICSRFMDLVLEPDPLVACGTFYVMDALAREVRERKGG